MHSTWDREFPEKEVAMIAQKIVDAKHAEQERRRLVTATNPRAFTFGTSHTDH